MNMKFVPNLQKMTQVMTGGLKSQHFEIVILYETLMFVDFKSSAQQLINMYNFNQKCMKFLYG